MSLKHNLRHIFFLSLINLLGISTPTAYTQEAKLLLPEGTESTYKACKDVIITSKDKYQDNLEEWKLWEKKCHQRPHIIEETGIGKINVLNEAPQYLNLAFKVSTKVLTNLDKSYQYAQCSYLCFSGASSCDKTLSDTHKTIKCQERRMEILHVLKAQAKEIRMELALSRDASNLIDVNVTNILTIDIDHRFNKNLEDFELATPNPLGNHEMSSEEIESIKKILKEEYDSVGKKYQKMLIDQGIKNTPELYRSWMAKALMDQIDERKSAHREKYRQLIYERFPLFAVIDNPMQFKNGHEPIWGDRQIADAFQELSKNAQITKTSVEESVRKGQLEAGRANGEALGQWLLQLMPGNHNHNDLLYYMGMKNQVEEVLQEDKSLCATATTLSNRLASKHTENTGIVFIGSMLGGPIMKESSSAAAGIFRIGRALTGSEASILTGLAISSISIGDSFRQYKTSIQETTSSVREADSIEAAKKKIAINVAIAPMIAPALDPVEWASDKLLYTILGNKMGRDLPEISILIKEAGITKEARNSAVNNWIITKIAAAIKHKVIRSDDELLLHSKAGEKVMNVLADDIQKNNPHFFTNPDNFDFFFKAAATSLQRHPGDPPDLGHKIQHLFISFNTNVFHNCYAKARLGLIKAFGEGVSALRDSFKNNPAEYAAFTDNPASQEKIMFASLKRSGVVNDAEILEMKNCTEKR